MGRPPQTAGVPVFRFLPHEGLDYGRRKIITRLFPYGRSCQVAEMDRMLEANNGVTLPRQSCDILAQNFSNAPERKNQIPIKGKQVWNWFQNRRHAQKVKMVKAQELGKTSQTNTQNPVFTPSRPKLQVTGRIGGEFEKEMEFEAKSSRDGAWYDVKMFLEQRVENGLPEVRVRFIGFGPEEDEWVNIKTCVRLRSLPCEALECVVILKDDLILCFQEGNEQALYYDAVVVNVHRRRHDARGCRCRFWVRYLHDQSEEVVPLKKVCRRPESDLRLHINGKIMSFSSEINHPRIRH